MFYWQTKYFKTREEMTSWAKKHEKDYQIREIFVNNEYALEYKSLIKC